MMSPENEIHPAHKCQSAKNWKNNFWHFNICEQDTLYMTVFDDLTLKNLFILAILLSMSSKIFMFS